MAGRYDGLDGWEGAAIAAALLDGQTRALAALAPVLPRLAEAAEAVAARWRQGGRLVYAGAGSSGVIARLDGLELPGTYGLDPDRIRFLTPEGLPGLARMRGGPEDDGAAGAAEAAALSLTPTDALIAVAASGTTPYTLGVAAAARARGAHVTSVTCRIASPLAALAHIAVEIDCGPEVIEGSTRMAAGTAQKAALNIVSTLLGVALGGVHDNLMVGMMPENAKLVTRAEDIVARITGLPISTAASALTAAGNDIRTAVLIAEGATPEAARARLSASGGHLRAARAANQPRQETDMEDCA